MPNALHNYRILLTFVMYISKKGLIDTNVRPNSGTKIARIQLDKYETTKT